MISLNHVGVPCVNVQGQTKVNYQLMLNRIWSNVKGLNLKKEEEREYKAYIVLSKNQGRYEPRISYLSNRAGWR